MGLVAEEVSRQFRVDCKQKRLVAIGKLVGRATAERNRSRSRRRHPTCPHPKGADAPKLLRPFHCRRPAAQSMDAHAPAA